MVVLQNRKLILKMKFKKITPILILTFFSLFYCFNGSVADDQDLVPYQRHYIEGARHWVNFIESEDNEELGQAITEFQKAIEENSNFADAYFQLGAIYNIQGKSQEAGQLMDRGKK